MTADAGTALSELTREETLQFLSTLGWSLALGLSLLIWAMLEKADIEHRRKTGGEPKRDGSSEQAQRERLFGVRRSDGPSEDEAPSTAEASGDPERDEGRSDSEG